MPTDEPTPPPAAARGAAPKHLSAHAKTEWHALYEPLRACGLLTVADRPAFAGYCAAMGRHIEAEEELKRGKSIVTTPNGHEQASPWIAISRHSLEQATRLMLEFGMTPAARARLAKAPVPPAPPTDDGQAPTPEVQAGKFTGLVGRA